MKGKLKTDLLQELQTLSETELESRVVSKSFRKEVMGRSAGQEDSSKPMQKDTPSRPKTKQQAYKITQQQLQQEIDEMYPKQVIQIC